MNKVQHCVLMLSLCLAMELGHAAGVSKPHADYVPDERTAISIGQAILIARYGEESVKTQLPLRAIKGAGGFWIVQRTESGLGML